MHPDDPDFKYNYFNSMHPNLSADFNFRPVNPVSCAEVCHQNESGANGPQNHEDKKVTQH